MKQIIMKIADKILLRFKKRATVISESISTVGTRTAVKSDFGFWYVGDICDRSDISYGIANNGYIEKEETDLVVKILKKMIDQQQEKPFVFYDIGANTGYYGILATIISNKIKSYSFEPVKKHVEILKESIYLNRLEDRVKVFEMALGNKSGETIINLSGSGSTIIDGFNNISSDKTAKIQIETLAEMFSSGKIELPDFIKMDVEGSELDVLKGGAEELKKSSPVMFVEIISKIENRKLSYNNPLSSHVVSFLQDDLGYELYCLVGNKLMQVDYGWDIEGPRMYLCLKSENHKYIKDLLCL